MCLSSPKSPPPPPPPAPPAPPPPTPELKKDEKVDMAADPSGVNKGRKKLRIDLASGAGAGSEGAGLNIPS